MRWKMNSDPADFCFFRYSPARNEIQPYRRHGDRHTDQQTDTADENQTDAPDDELPQTETAFKAARHPELR